MSRLITVHFLFLCLTNSTQAQFDTVINLPDDQPSISGSIGNRSGDLTPTTQLNVADGGSVDRFFFAHAGSEVNITGGRIGTDFRAGPGSVVNISGGSVNDGFWAYDGSDVNISGGRLGRLTVSPDADIELIGGEFTVNGIPYSGSTINRHPIGLFTGTLSDGSTFIIHSPADPLLGDATLTLTRVPLPTIDTMPQFVSTDISTNPLGLRSGQILTVQAGGILGNNFAVVEGTLNIEDGVVGHSVEVAGGLVNISGGRVGEDFNALAGSVINISGGIVGNFFHARSESQVKISGGTIGRFKSDSVIELVGGEFVLNGSPYTGSIITIGSGDVLSGTLSDGSTLIFRSDTNPFAGDRLYEPLSLTTTTLPALDTSHRFVDSDITEDPSGLRAGQRLTLLEGGVLGDNYAVVNATLNMQDGELGDYAEVVGSLMNIDGGKVGDEFFALSGSKVNISGGKVGDDFSAQSGSEVNISGGTIGKDFRANSGSLVNIEGGSVGSGFDAFSESVVNIQGGFVESFSAKTGSTVNMSGGEVNGFLNIWPGSLVNISGGRIINGSYAHGSVNISGGILGDFIYADSGSEVNLFGNEFFLDGVLLDSLTIGSVFEITDRGGAVLSGTLADGSPFEFILDDTELLFQDYFDPEATLTVTLVPLYGDFNGDNIVDLADYTVWRNNLGALTEAEIGWSGDGQGGVDQADYLLWKDNFGNATSTGAEGQTVPEPGGVILTLIVVACCATILRLGATGYASSDAS